MGMTNAPVLTRRQVTVHPARADRLTMLLHSRWPYATVAVAGLIMHLALALPIYAWYDRLLAWGPLVILLFLVYRYMHNGEKSVPLLAVVALQIYIFYSVPQFSQDKLLLYSGLYQPSRGALTSACLLALLGELAFILGFQGLRKAWGNRPNIFDRILPRPSQNWSLAIVLYAIPSLVVYVLIALRPDYIPVGGRFALSSLLNVLMALVLSLYLGYKLRRRRMVRFAYVIIVIMIMIGFIQGMMGAIVMPILILFMCVWMWGRAVRLRWVLVVLVAIIVINPAKNLFRTLAWDDKDVSSLKKVESRLGDWKSAFVDVWTGQTIAPNIMETASRASDLLDFAQAVDLVPASIPYDHGKGMAIALVFWVPRIVWPSKPSGTELLNNRYSVEFGLQSTEGTRTSTAAISAFTEGYWNLGWSGVLVFLFGVGAILGFFFGNNGKTGDLSAIACTVYLAQVILPLQAFSFMLSPLITFTAGVWLAMWGLAWLSNITAHR